MSKVQNKFKNDTKSTKDIRKLQKKIDKLEMMIKRLQLEFSWYDSKNEYAHCAMHDQIKLIDESRQLF